MFACPVRRKNNEEQSDSSGGYSLIALCSDGHKAWFNYPDNIFVMEVGETAQKSSILSRKWEKEAFEYLCGGSKMLVCKGRKENNEEQSDTSAELFIGVLCSDGYSS